MRREVVNQHFRDSQTQDQAVRNSDISSDFLDALPFEIRNELLRQERADTERRSRSETPAPAAAPAPFTASIVLQQFEDVLNSLPSRSNNPVLSQVTPTVKKSSNKDSMQLMDKCGITSLLRLIFIPEPCAKSVLNRILTNLCENSRSRAELLNILVSILEDGIHDLAAVDKGLSELSLKADRPQKIKWGPPVGDEIKNVPNLVAQRCLEALTLLVTSGSSSSRFFLTETDKDHVFKTPRSSKKGKEKEKLVVNHIPAVSLLKLLERPTFLQNSAILEQLMTLISNVLRPLSLIAKKKLSQKQELSSHSKSELVNELKGETETTKNESGESKPEAGSASTDITSKDKPDIKLPVLPDHAVQCVVNVLKDGICSLKTFQNTLHAIQYISTYPEHRITIIKYLLESAQDVSNLIIPSLIKLITQLSSVKSSTEMEENVLTDFAAPTANQAKLLRILKTIDFLNKPDEVELKKNEFSAIETAYSTLRNLYEKLNIASLWHKLSEAMAIVEQKEGVIHVATVLLPLIESFLVKSKPFVHVKRSPTSSILLKQGSEIIEEEPASNGFLQFTKDHSKILNT